MLRLLHVLNDKPRLSLPIKSDASFLTHTLIALEHALNKVPQRAPKILAAGKIVFIYEKDIVLEACVEVRFESELDNDRVMVAVNVGVDSVQALEKLLGEVQKGFGKRHPWNILSIFSWYDDYDLIPIRLGNIDSLSMLLCTQAIRCSI